MGDILVKGHLFSIVFISKFLGCWFKWQFKKKWYSSSFIRYIFHLRGCSPRNERLNLPVRIKFLNVFLYSSK